MKKSAIKLLLEKEWTKHEINGGVPLWEPIDEVPVAKPVRKEVDYFRVKDINVDKGYATRSKVKGESGDKDTADKMDEAVDNEETEADALNTYTSYDLVAMIKKIGIKECIVRAQKLFNFETRTKSQERKLAMIQPLDLLSDVQHMYESSDEDETDYTVTYNPCYETSYEQRMKKGNFVFYHPNVIESLIGSKIIYPSGNVYKRSMGQIIHDLPPRADMTKRERVQNFVNEYEELKKGYLPPRLNHFILKGMNLRHHCHLSLLSTVVLAASLEENETQRNELNIMCNALFAKLSSRLLTEATLVMKFCNGQNINIRF